MHKEIEMNIEELAKTRAKIKALEKYDDELVAMIRKQAVDDPDVRAELFGKESTCKFEHGIITIGKNPPVFQFEDGWDEKRLVDWCNANRDQHLAKALTTVTFNKTALKSLIDNGFDFGFGKNYALEIRDGKTYHLQPTYTQKEHIKFSAHK
jgi:hypothetical protein